VELRVRGERAVLSGRGAPHTREIDPHSLALGVELAEALHEWARVAAAVRRARHTSEPGQAAAVVTRRGYQLATRVAAVMGTAVYYVDPVSDETVVIPPPRPAPAPTLANRLFGASRPDEEPPPWGTGLVVAAFIAAVVITAMLALANAMAAEVSGWLVIVAAVVVTAGLTPSLWLARRLPIVRWIALGAAAGMIIAWFGVLAIAL
jgi:hypothetical protein